MRTNEKLFLVRPHAVIESPVVVLFTGLRAVWTPLTAGLSTAIDPAWLTRSGSLTGPTPYAPISAAQVTGFAAVLQMALTFAVYLDDYRYDVTIRDR